MPVTGDERTGPASAGMAVCERSQGLGHVSSRLSLNADHRFDLHLGIVRR